jgi:hypothetical protein
MRQLLGSALLLTMVVPLASGCAANSGLPNNGMAMVTPLSLEPPPIYALLGYRRDLDLTSDQVAALDAIAQEVQEENRPLVRELQENSRERARQPGIMVVTPEGEPILDEIRANQRRAGEAVAALLDEEQRATVCRLFDRNRPGTRGAPARPAAAQATAGSPDRREFDPIGWYWCAEPAIVAELAE